MIKVIILGSSNAIPVLGHENTYLALVGKQRTVLVDCPSNPLVRLEKTGIDYNEISDIVLTHFHPDHISGLPPFLMSMWLLGRQTPLTIYGLKHTIDRMESLMGFYDWKTWPNFFPIEFVTLPNKEGVKVLTSDDFAVICSPVKHIIPTLGLRFESKKSGKLCAYSCDTEPCDAVIRLAQHADILIHEASGEFFGHSSAFQAGEIAQKAGVKSLLLIHYQTRDIDSTHLIDEARQAFQGEVDLARDFAVIDLN